MGPRTCGSTQVPARNRRLDFGECRDRISLAHRLRALSATGGYRRAASYWHDAWRCPPRAGSPPTVLESSRLDARPRRHSVVDFGRRCGAYAQRLGPQHRRMATGAGSGIFRTVRGERRGSSNKRGAFRAARGLFRSWRGDCCAIGPVVVVGTRVGSLIPRPATALACRFMSR